MTSIPVKLMIMVGLLIGGSTTLINKTNGEADADMTLPAGFTATTAIESLGNARHLVVNSNGDIYVKLEKLKDGKGIYVLRDANKDGKYEIVKSFGNYIGTGIA